MTKAEKGICHSAPAEPAPEWRKKLGEHYAAEAAQPPDRGVVEFLQEDMETFMKTGTSPVVEAAEAAPDVEARLRELCRQMFPKVFDYADNHVQFMKLVREAYRMGREDGGGK